MRLLGRKPAYKGTISGLRISAVDGTAFIDACSDLTTYADGAHRVEIYDSANKMLAGFLKAQGNGETLGGELHTSANCISDPNGNEADATTGIVPPAEGTVTSTSEGSPAVGTYHLLITVTNAYTGCRIPITVSAGRLYRVSRQSKRGTASGGFVGWDGAYSQAIVANEPFGNTDYESATVSYCVAKDSTLYLLQTVNDSGGTNYLDNLSVNQVTAPSANGATLVSTKGGTTYNFTFKDSGFSYNKASYRVIVRDYA